MGLQKLFVQHHNKPTMNDHLMEYYNEPLCPFKVTSVSLGIIMTFMHCGKHLAWDFDLDEYTGLEQPHDYDLASFSGLNNIWPL